MSQGESSGHPTWWSYPWILNKMLFFEASFPEEKVSSHLPSKAVLVNVLGATCFKVRLSFLLSPC